jgi:mRNA interferase RelE/StbE
MAGQYEVRITPEAASDLKPLSAYYQRHILDGIVRHLTFHPRQVSKSRIKLMEQPFWSQYRLRIGDYRVYYDVDDGRREVVVLHVLGKGSGQTPTEKP